jgi:endonuclease/exonuclease/phosphatase family metal-dependent hydrolase
MWMAAPALRSRFRSIERAAGIVLTALLFTACQAHQNIQKAPVEQVKELNLLTYNVRIGMGTASPGTSPYHAQFWKKDLARVAAAIRSTGADVVAVQELLDGQEEELGKLLGMNYAFARHGAIGPGDWWGVGVLSKFPITSSFRDVLSTGSGNSRSNAVVTVMINRKPHVFISIHKDKDLGDGVSVDRTADTAKEYDGPVSVMGDFNLWPEDPIMKKMPAKLVDTALAVDTVGTRFLKKTGTLNGAHHADHRGRIDYIFVDPKYYEVLDTHLMDKAHWDASDHYGVVAKVRLK